MDPSGFDTLTRAIAQTGTRRWLLRLVATLPLAGALTTISEEEAAAERPIDRVQGRTPQRNRQQRNKKNNNNQNNKNKKNNNGGGGGSRRTSSACVATGNICSQDSDCCSGNCFNFVCAERVTQCSQGGTSTQCVPPAKGCAGGSCCYGSAGCGTSCCITPANQCNPQGACCAPNCAGRSCGDDGCGSGGTCGSCKNGQTCNATTGQCQGRVTCSAQTCPNGCCDAAGICQPNSREACGTGGAACAPCSGSTTICRNGQCDQLANTLGCLCNNGARPATCTTRACAADTFKAICPSMCAGAGGWAISGEVAECNPHSCLP